MAFDPNNLYYWMVQKYVENKTDDDIIIFCNEGSSRCLAPESEVVTDICDKKICDIKVGDTIKSRNVDGNFDEYKKVVRTFKLENIKPCIRIKMKDGSEVIGTEDHRLLHEGTWTSLKQLLYLHNNRKYK